MIFTENPVTIQHVIDGINGFSYSEPAVQYWVNVMLERDYDTTLEALDKIAAR